MSAIGRLFMEIPGVSGEAADNEFKGQVELDSWDWSLSRKEKDDGGRGEIEPSVFRFSKRMDKSSTQLLNKLKSGEKLEAKFTLVEASDLPFKLVVEMQNVRVVKYSLDGKDEDAGGAVEETWIFNYDEISFVLTTELTRNKPTTVPSNPIKRPAGATTDRPDPVGEMIDGFASLDASDQDNVISEINKKFGGAISGPLPKAPESLKPVPKLDKIKQVVQGFSDLIDSDRKKAARQMKEKFLDALK